MKKLSGFSLMEMMVVLLIVSVVAAASAPMINKKMVTAATDKSPWVWVGHDNNIAYNLNGADRTASIGATLPPNNLQTRLYIDSNGNKPQLSFGENGANILKLISAKKNIWFSGKDADFEKIQNSIVIGSEAKTSASNAIVIGSADSVSQDAISIGQGVKKVYDNAIAVGKEADASADRAIALGASANASDVDAIAIGSSSNASTYSIAIGYATDASGSANTIAIGRNVKTNTGNDSIVIGYYAGSNNSSVAANNAIIIGSGAAAIDGSHSTTKPNSAIAIGQNSRVNNQHGIAIGAGSNAVGLRSISIGAGGGSIVAANAVGTNAIAIGSSANAFYTNSTAIGRGAKTTADNQIVLGTADDTIVIKGKLVVEGDTLLGGNVGAKTYVRESNDDNELHIFDETYGDVDLQGSGSIRGMNFDKTGDLIFSGKTYLKSSDRRLKNISKAFVGGLKELKALDLFHYTYKKDPSKTPHVGVMAQDLQKIFPDAVIKGEDGFLRIRMEDMFYAVINAVKENDKRITTLEKENQELKKRLADIEKKIK